MQTEKVVIVNRLSQILDALLMPATTTIDNVLFENLITHISAKENAYVQREPMLHEWIKKCLTLLEADFFSVNRKVIAFMLKLCGILSTNEWLILKMKECKIFDRVWNFIKLNSYQFNAQLKLATINLLSSLAQFSFGIIYMRMIKGWQILIDYCKDNQTVYVVREAQQLLYKIIYDFSVKAKDDELLIEVFSEILQPIMGSVYEERDGSIKINVEDKEDQRRLSSVLDLMAYIFQQTLESSEKTNIVQICIHHFNIEVNFWKLFEIALNIEFVGKVLNALISYNFALLLYTNWEQSQIPPENFNYFGLLFFNQIKFLVTRFDCMNFLKVMHLYHVMWKRLGPRAPKVIQIENERVCFENQLIAFHILPLLFSLQTKEILKTELFDRFVDQLFEISCEQTTRLCYGFRDVLVFIKEGSTSFIAELAYKSVHSILSLGPRLEREHAVLVFKAMIYPLHDIALQITEISSCTSSNRFTHEEIQNILYNVLVGLRTLIERYHISWKESIETINLINCVGWLLESSNLPTRLTVQGLKLIQLSIEHFLSPNMALLVNSLHGSGLVRLGPMIVKRIDDSSWDVRDSVIELVTSIAEISRNMFPAFQQFLMDNKICPAVYKLLKHDDEPYVRASAFKCHATFVTINVIWENELKNLDIIEHLFSVLYNESEGIVRKEAVCCMIKIYEYRKIPQQHMATFYSILAHCTIADLHWEVRMNALNFWKLEIQRQFTHQGMIDGTFPTVTFSKEHRKIVTLTEKEINLRIIKAFKELSQSGCLGVLFKVLTEDCDVEVIKAAVRIVENLLKMLDKYDYETLLKDSTTESMSTSNSTMSKSSNSSTENSMITSSNTDYMDLEQLIMPKPTHTVCTCSDSVITDILATNDLNLLANANENRMEIPYEPLQIDQTFFKQFTTTTTKEFITYAKSIDFEQLLQKNEWHLPEPSFTSLLEEIISVLPPLNDSAIASDCY